jgi:hypothetical protein
MFMRFRSGHKMTRDRDEDEFLQCDRVPSKEDVVASETASVMDKRGRARMTTQTRWLQIRMGSWMVLSWLRVDFTW